MIRWVVVNSRYLTFLFFLMNFLFEESFGQSRNLLPLPAKDHSFELLVTGVRNLLTEGENTVIFPSHENFIVRRNLKPGLPFDKPFDNSEKIFPDQLKVSGRWLMQAVEKGYLLLDGDRLEMHYYSLKFQQISSHSLWYDRILPPKDRGGEAPAFEVKSFRKKFLKRFKEAGVEKISGMVRIPGEDKYPLYLLTTNIPDFPFLILSCQAESPGQCYIKRGCFSEGMRTKTADIVGLASDPGGEAVYIGDRSHNRIELFRYQSCGHIVHRGLIYLPERLKQISALTIGSDKSLYVATKLRDDYFNASLFRWPVGAWLPR